MNTARQTSVLAAVATSIVGLGSGMAAERSNTSTRDATTTAPAEGSVGDSHKATTPKRRRLTKRQRAKRALARHNRRAAALARSLNRAVELKTIDTAFEAGSLTWDEAKALYAEQAIVRSAFIAHRDHDHRNLRRVRFIRRTARTSLLRLRHNLAQRIYVDEDDGAPRRAVAKAE